jgi:hypothetical protein
MLQSFISEIIACPSPASVASLIMSYTEWRKSHLTLEVEQHSGRVSHFSLTLYTCWNNSSLLSDFAKEWRVKDSTFSSIQLANNLFRFPQHQSPYTPRILWVGDLFLPEVHRPERLADHILHCREKISNSWHAPALPSVSLKRIA